MENDQTRSRIARSRNRRCHKKQWYPHEGENTQKHAKVHAGSGFGPEKKNGKIYTRKKQKGLERKAGHKREEKTNLHQLKPQNRPSNPAREEKGPNRNEVNEVKTPHSVRKEKKKINSREFSKYGEGRLVKNQREYQRLLFFDGNGKNFSPSGKRRTAGSPIGQ